jgi:hypothetical protein
MALKTVCVVPYEWTLETYRTHHCSDGSHIHISYAELHENKARHAVKILHEARSRRERTVVQIFLVPAGHKASVTSSVCAPRSLNYGLSNKVGELLAEAIRNREEWALVMYAQMKNRREDSFEEINVDELIAAEVRSRKFLQQISV